jgi:hypothetical protein
VTRDGTSAQTEPEGVTAETELEGVTAETELEGVTAEKFEELAAASQGKTSNGQVANASIAKHPVRIYSLWRRGGKYQLGNFLWNSPSNSQLVQKPLRG